MAWETEIFITSSWDLREQQLFSTSERLKNYHRWCNVDLTFSVLCICAKWGSWDMITGNYNPTVECIYLNKFRFSLFIVVRMETSLGNPEAVVHIAVHKGF